MGLEFEGVRVDRLRADYEGYCAMADRSRTPEMREAMRGALLSFTDWMLAQPAGYRLAMGVRSVEDLLTVLAAARADDRRMRRG